MYVCRMGEDVGWEVESCSLAGNADHMHYGCSHSTTKTLVRSTLTSLQINEYSVIPSIQIWDGEAKCMYTFEFAVSF